MDDPELRTYKGVTQVRCPRCNKPMWPRGKPGLDPECWKCRGELGIECSCDYPLDDRWGGNLCEGCGERMPDEAYCDCPEQDVEYHPGFRNPAPLKGKQLSAEEYNQVNRCQRCGKIV